MFTFLSSFLMDIHFISYTQKTWRKLNYVNFDVFLNITF